MIAKSLGTGSGILDLGSYLMHDRTSPENPRPPSSERVADAGLVNLAHGSIAEGIAEMRGIVRDQAVLKRLAGVSARGRPVRDPYLHLVGSWPPGHTPSREEIEEVVHGVLDSLGMGDHQAFWVLHVDTDHRHVHIAANRIHPDTGRTVKLSFEKKKLSAWALAYEQKRGCIEVPGRLARQEWRNEARELFQQRDEARAANDARRAWELTRALERHRDQRPRVEPTRGPGREARSPEERSRWDALYNQQREEQHGNTPALAEEQLAARVRLSRSIDRDRERAKRRAAAAAALATATRALVDSARSAGRAVAAAGRTTQAAVRPVASTAVRAGRAVGRAVGGVLAAPGRRIAARTESPPPLPGRVDPPPPHADLEATPAPRLPGARPVTPSSGGRGFGNRVRVRTKRGRFGVHRAQPAEPAAKAPSFATTIAELARDNPAVEQPATSSPPRGRLAHSPSPRPPARPDRRKPARTPSAPVPQSRHRHVPDPAPAPAHVPDPAPAPAPAAGAGARADAGRGQDRHRNAPG